LVGKVLLGIIVAAILAVIVSISIYSGSPERAREAAAEMSWSAQVDRDLANYIDGTTYGPFLKCPEHGNTGAFQTKKTRTESGVLMYEYYCPVPGHNFWSKKPGSRKRSLRP
jgi:hypothetical protein